MSPYRRAAASKARILLTILAAIGMTVTLSTPATARTTVAPRGNGAPAASPNAQPVFRDHGSTLRLRVPAASGYTIIVQRKPFQITTQRTRRTVLQTTAGTTESSGPAAFHTATGWATATAVQRSSWHGGVLDLTLATSKRGNTIAYRITPQADRYRTTWSVHGSDPVTQVASHYVIASAGHWYGQGEAQTADGGQTRSSRGRWIPTRCTTQRWGRPSTL